MDPINLTLRDTWRHGAERVLSHYPNFENRHMQTARFVNTERDGVDFQPTCRFQSIVTHAHYRHAEAERTGPDRYRIFEQHAFVEKGVGLGPVVLDLGLGRLERKPFRLQGVYTETSNLSAVDAKKKLLQWEKEMNASPIWGLAIARDASETPFHPSRMVLKSAASAPLNA